MEILVVFCWFLLCCVANAAGELTLTVSPENIEVGLTASLTLNCTFTNDGKPELAALISFFISRKSNDSEASDYGEELASLNSYVHHVNDILPEFNSSTGKISWDGVSYLELNWLYPTERQKGIYICKAQGIDVVGHTVSITERANVTFRQPEKDEILSRIKELNENLKNAEQKFSDLYTNMSANFYQFAGSQSKHDDDVNKTLTVLETFVKEVRPFVGLFEQSLFYPIEMFFRGHFYKILRAPVLGGDDAVALCESYGLNLVEIDDFIEYESITNLLNQHPRIAAISVAGRYVNNRWLKQYSNDTMFDQTSFVSIHTIPTPPVDCVILTYRPHWNFEAVSCEEMVFQTPYSQVNAMCETKS